MDLAGRRILVTGATGFVGSHVVRALVEGGASVTAVAAGPGWRSTVPELARRGAVRFAALDVLSPAASAMELASALDGVEGVVHLAYTPAPAGSRLEQAVFEVERNVVGTSRLLRALPGSVRSLAFASSVMVYGPSPKLPAAEDGCARPGTAYAKAKAAIEGLMEDFAADRGLAVHSLRYATVYGQLETVPRAVPNFIRQALGGQAPVVRGAGDDVRDYVHVSDVARATLSAIARDQPGHWICNVGSGQGRTTNEIAERVASLVGCDEPVVHLPSAAPPTQIVCDLRRARALLGYEPRMDFDEGLRQEIRWFAERPELWSTAATLQTSTSRER